MVSTGVIICVFIELFLVFAIPIALIIVWSKKTKTGILPYIIGAVTFFVFALILEQIAHTFCLVLDNPVSAAIKNTPALYILYGAFAAGIFEECGRFISFKLFGKKIFTSKKTSVAYGIGHGGIEAIILVGISVALNMIIYAFMINSMGVEQFTMMAGESQKAALESVAQSVIGTSPSDCLITVWERISAIILHISLSVLVYISTKDKKKLWLFPVSILLHAAFDVAPVMYQIKILNSLLLIEVIIFVAAVIIGIVAITAYRRYSDVKE